MLLPFKSYDNTYNCLYKLVFCKALRLLKPSEQIYVEISIGLSQLHFASILPSRNVLRTRRLVFFSHARGFSATLASFLKAQNEPYLDKTRLCYICLSLFCAEGRPFVLSYCTGAVLC